MLEAILSSSLAKVGGELLSKLKDRKQSRALFDQQKRRILETRMSHIRWGELRKLRDIFLQHGVADKSDTNREFFDKWLTHPVIEMGLTPTGGWTVEQIRELHTDLERVQA
jgi:hypothetical protein